MPKQAVKATTKKVYGKTQPVRLYVKGIFTGFRRGRSTQTENQALVHIENVKDKTSAKWYLGKRVAHIYKAKTLVNNTKFRVSWGKVVNTHGHAGAVRVKFSRNLNPGHITGTVRVMLYPNKT